MDDLGYMGTCPVCMRPVIDQGDYGLTIERLDSGDWAHLECLEDEGSHAESFDIDLSVGGEQF